MGHDKALLRIDGTPMAERLARRLREAGASEVLAVGGEAGREAAAPAGSRWVADGWPGAGPVGGIATALGAATTERVLVVACDLPALTAVTMAVIARTHAEAGDGIDAVVARSERGPEPLIASWAQRSRPTLVEAMASGGPSVRGVLDRVSKRSVDVTDTELTNLNRPAELAAFLADDVAVGTLPAAPVSRRSAMDVPEIDVAALAAELAAGRPLVDVREADEYADARVPGGVLIPLATVPERLDEIPSEGTVYVVCRSGGRSAQAVAYLRDRGVDAVNVAGGTLAWMEADREVERG